MQALVAWVSSSVADLLLQNEWVIIMKAYSYVTRVMNNLSLIANRLFHDQTKLQKARKLSPT